MKYTVFTQFECSTIAGYSGCMLEKAIKFYNEGHDVTLVYCDEKCGVGCWYNVDHNKKVCRHCQKYWQLLFKSLPSAIKLVPLSDFAKFIRHDYVFDYETTEDIRNLLYRDVQVGATAFSTYLSLTRNLYPLIDERFKLFFDKLLTIACEYTDMTIKILETFKTDHIGCFNSRLLFARAIVDLAKKYGIDYTSYDGAYTSIGQLAIASYPNSTPHDANMYNQIINDLWESPSISQEQKITIAENFYYKRKNSIFSGDKLYVKDQQQGLLPSDWNPDIKNIVIFNSSEDEFACLGKEFLEGNLFSSQYEGIKYMVKKYRDCENIHIYLRIHPNLKDVKYAYQVKLHDLQYLASNFTVIPGDSPVSSYALMDACDKVVVFGSTMGIEAVFWGKPVILLSYCLYKNLDICYIPTTQEELDRMILFDDLSPKNKLGALKCGFARMNDLYEQYKYYPVKSKKIRILKHYFQVDIYYTLPWFRQFLLLYHQLMGKRVCYANRFCPTEEDPQVIM